MIKYLPKLAFVLLLCGFISGCEIINPEEEQPGFITINKPTFSQGTFDSDSHEIVSAWVYVKGRLLGVFDLPATIPVLSSGETRISVNAGVIADGQRAVRDMYTFYASYHETINIVPGQSYSITPNITYDTGVDAPIEENFEVSLADFIGENGYTLQRIQINPDDSLFYPRGGSKIGIVYSKPDTADVIKIVSTGTGVTLPRNAPVYLELDLRSSIPVAIGLQYISNGVSYGPVYEVTAFPSGEWKKYYISLFNEVGVANDAAAKFKILFLASPGTFGKDYVAIDNVRLVHF